MRTSTILITLATLSTSALAQSSFSTFINIEDDFPTAVINDYLAITTDPALYSALAAVQTNDAVLSAGMALDDLALTAISQTAAVESLAANWYSQQVNAVTGTEHAAAASAFAPIEQALLSASSISSVSSHAAGAQGSHQSAAVGLVAGALSGLAAFVMAL